MAVITISRLVGSKGTLIGKEVAKKMDYKYVDISHVQEIMDQYGEINFKKVYDQKISIWDRYSVMTNDMLQFFKRVMESIAKSGNVLIIGRGSFISLGQYSDVLDVMVYAPLETRIGAIMEMRDITDKEKAKNYIIKKEKIRQSFIEQTFNVRWNQIENFDMVFNTGKLTSGSVIDSIVSAAKLLENTAPDTSKAYVSDIETDRILDDTVKSILNK